MEMQRIIQQGQHEYFLNIDDEVDEEDDTLHGGVGHSLAKSKDAFHPIVSVDVGTAKMIQIAHEKQISLEKEPKSSTDDEDNDIEQEEEKEEENVNHDTDIIEQQTKTSDNESQQNDQD